MLNRVANRQSSL